MSVQRIGQIGAYLDLVSRDAMEANALYSDLVKCDFRSCVARTTTSRAPGNASPLEEAEAANDAMQATNEALQSMNEELQCVIEDLRARDAAGQQLRQREADIVHAQRVNSVGELAAGIAHELAQPLAAMANEVGACIRFVRAGHPDRPTLLGALQRAGAEAERAGHVLQHLRQLVERRPAALAIVDLRELVGESAALVHHEIDRRHIRFHVALGRRPLWVWADGIQIEQVLVNLLRNAIEAVDASRVQKRNIDMRCRRTTAANAEVTVRDNGAGVDAAAFDRLFDSFFTTKPHGLGMGLAISRRIVESHRGRIWMDRPTRDASTTVRVTLPLLPSRRP